MTDSKKLNLGIKEILGRDVPEFEIDVDLNEDRQEQVEANSTDFEFDTKAEEFKIEIPQKVENDYEQLFEGSKWKELLEASQAKLEDDSNDLEAKIYWNQASIELAEIKPEIIAIGLENIFKENSSDLKQHKAILARTSKKIIEKVQDKDQEQALSLYEAWYDLDSKSAKPHFRDFCQKQYKSLKEVSETKPENDEVFKTIETIEEWQKKFGIKIKEEKLDIPKAKQNRTSFSFIQVGKLLLIIFILFVLPIGSYLYISEFHFKETPIRLFSGVQAIDFVEPEVNINIKLQAPALMTLDDSLKLEDILSELLADTVSLPTKTNSLKTAQAERAAQIQQTTQLDLNGPKEPAELTLALQQGEIKKSEPVATETPRSPYIVSGSSRNDPIVEGQIISGQQQLKTSYARGDFVSTTKRTSLFIQPDRLEAELTEIRPGERLLVIRDYDHWLKVEMKNGRWGYVQKSAVR